MNIFDVLNNNVIKHPNNPIWEDDENTYTISDMEYLSGKIYHYLKDNCIGREDIVAIRIPRSANIPLVMIGVWKAGAAFVVIGEHTTQDLADYQLSQTEPKMVFSAEQYDEAMAYDYIEGYENVDEHDLACVVYSTGSTGVFKGSMHEYGAIQKAVNRSFEFCDFYGFSAIKADEYRLLFSAGFYTMTAIYSLIDSLVLSYYQYVLPYETIGNIEACKHYLSDKKINSYVATTRDYQVIKDLNSPYLKELSVSLDMISCQYSDNQQIYNYYGMSEAVGVLTCFKLDKSYDVTPIGIPFNDISMIISDDNGNSLTDGSIGEVCFKPDYWRGYISQVEKTNAAYYDGWFHTGDMGYINEDGNYVIVGRKVDVAKTENGYIVPMLISVAFQKAFSDIEKCHVQIFKDKSKPVVCLYYCGIKEYSIEQIRQALSDTFPENCLPTHCYKMDEFEYYPSGKLNRNSFPNPSMNEQEELSIEEIKQSEKETLLIFREFCEKNNLKYYIAFGTLLGAVRHKGFIPWDDDIDILMPREDYNYLIEHFNDVVINNRELVSKETYPEFYMDIAKIVDRNTTAVENGQTFEIGVWIDVFPMDYLVDNMHQYQKANRHIALYSALIEYAALRPSKNRKAYKNFITRIFMLVLPSKEWLLKRKMKYLVPIISDIKSNTYGLLYRNFGKYGTPRFPTNYFEPSAKLSFEGELFDAPKEYDSLLRACYGDYMTLPKASERVSKHNYTCHWKEDVNK